MPSPLRLPRPDRLHGIMSGRDRDPLAMGLRLITNLGVPPYRLATGLRNALYDAGVLRSHPLGRPTVSVGNITTGGTGKTPMVIEIVQRLQRLGHRPAVLMRGYEPAGSDASSGSDEADLLRGSLGDELSVMANPSRVEGAREVLAKHPGVSVFVLDDGFQHRRAGRDLNLVLIDASAPFGFGRVLPRGLLREPLNHLKRADGVIVTRADRATPEQLAGLNTRIQTLTGQPPLAHVRHRWAKLRRGDEDLPVDHLADKALLGCTGLGHPADFEQSLREIAGECVGHVVFEDHHRYTPSDLAEVFQAAAQRQADGVVVTEKDWVKWRSLIDAVEPQLPVFRPVVQMQFLDGSDALDAALTQAAGGPRPPGDGPPHHPPVSN